MGKGGEVRRDKGGIGGFVSADEVQSSDSGVRKLSRRPLRRTSESREFWQLLVSSAVLNLKFLYQWCRGIDRNFKFAALAPTKLISRYQVPPCEMASLDASGGLVLLATGVVPSGSNPNSSTRYL